MNEDSCDINDVTHAASDLIAFGCHLGATQLYDSFAQLRFSEIVVGFANEVIGAVNDGIVSAKQGLQALKEEHADLSNKILFYAQNGVGAAAGIMQIQTGAIVIASTRGGAMPLGVLYYAHGANNVYEGVGNIYNGPTEPALVGPIRKGYQAISGDISTGNTRYYLVDLSLSGIGVFFPVRKTGSIELFNRDPLNYERAFKSAGKLALSLEILADMITIKNIKDAPDTK
ncbi:DUF4225 domain-containing protein [Pseudomonas baetica]|uniref:DUF4225 domain-containing protein n=1 Tax=Pseudomonas baetica TaxID=674054 RepID=UPI001C8BD3C8|nr:DUF4225 domain-containing protein [Pseudomonas baetica]MBX9409947.1 DUF4225 domain-containing protein [Pseudomonas baetica]